MSRSTGETDSAPRFDLKRSAWLALAACVGLGVVVATVSHRGDQTPGDSSTADPGMEDAAAMAPAGSPHVPPGTTSPPTPDVALPPINEPSNGPLRYDSQRNADFGSEAAKYAESFLPGLTADESPPVFVRLFEESVGSGAITNLFQQQGRAPPDGWSAAMEHRLGRFLEAQPEISATRASVSCRPSRCLIQFTELPPPPGQLIDSSRNAKAMVLRLMREPWFPEEFMAGGLPLTTPAQGNPVQYMVQILNRRPTGR